MTELKQLMGAALHHFEQAYAHLDQVIQAAQAQQAVLLSMLEAARQAAGLPAVGEAELQAFLKRPYVVLPLPGQLNRYWVIIPRFVGLRAGWPVRETETYLIFEASPFIRLLGMVPDWLAEELDFPPPDFRAVLDGLVLDVLDGDPAAVAKQLGGNKAISRRDGSRLYLRPASRFDVLRRIIKEHGFVPYAPAPVREALRRPRAVRVDDAGTPAFELRPHQQETYQQFLELGAVSIFAPAQAGKSFVVLEGCAGLRGRKLILCPRRALVEQWRDRTSLYLTDQAAEEVVVTTYQGAAKYLKERWSLVVFDEAHHLPANFAIETATQIQAETRMGLSASPFREDGHEFLIPALGGFPVGADWPLAPNQRPRITVWTFKDEAEKHQFAIKLAQAAMPGKTLIFTQRLAPGEAIAAQLDVPFVHGKTKNPRDVLALHPTVVASSIADEGLSIEGIQRVIEVDFLGGSRMQAAQRAGRLGNVGEDAAQGEHHVLMTRDEFHRFHKRLLAYVGAGYEISLNTTEPAPAAPLAGARRSRSSRITERMLGQLDAEVRAWLEVKAIRAKVEDAASSVPDRAVGYVPRVLQAVRNQGFSAEELALGWGIRDRKIQSWISKVCAALLAVGLLTAEASERFQLNKAEIDRLLHLSRSTRG